MGTALIVEDDPDQSALAAHLIRLRGYQVVEAETGAQGLFRARSSPPDLIVLDLMLPDTDGFDVCRRLRGDPATRPPR